jgi:hypothetical protein
VLKKDDSALCEDCYKKENRKCEICGKPSGMHPKCRACYYKTPGMGGSNSDPRAKYLAEYRTESGHYVRSKAEQKIADWFFRQDIKFTYEKKFPEENLICDFYIEKWDVWIEYWGLENEDYKQNKQRKLDIYAKHKKNLINVFEADIKNNLENLPQKLRPFIHTPFNFR